MPKLQSTVEKSLKPIYMFFRTNPSAKRTQSSVLSPQHLCFVVIPLLIALCSIPFTTADAAQIELTWDPPSESVTGFKVHYGSSSGSYDYSVDVGNYTNCTISGLQEGETYYFAATAYNAVDESNFSEELVYTIPTVSTGNSEVIGEINNPTATDVIEAEQMSDHTNGAKTGDYWMLSSNGDMSEDVYFSNSGTYQFEVTAKGDLADGVGPEMQLLIDGQSKGSVFVSSNTSEVYIFQVQVSAGNHEVAIAFNNDYYDPAQGYDRNLYVDKIAILSSSDNTATVIEAEQMSDHTNGIQKGDYWLLWANGTMNEDVDFPAAGTYHFEIAAKGDLANGVGPEMELLIDGQSQGKVFVNTNTPEIYILEAEVSAGTHELTLSFNNDFWDSAKGLDRNLYVDRIAITYN